MKYTRKEYLNHECTHSEYYNQYVTDSLKNKVKDIITLTRLTMSTDEHLNDIPLKLWDNIPMPYGIQDAMKLNGDYLTQAGIVCIAKAAARQILEEVKING